MSSSIMGYLTHHLTFMQLVEMRGSSFDVFSSLPAELRLKIWGYSLSSRFIEASLYFDVKEGWNVYYEESKAGTKNHRSLPALLSVNIEARQFCKEQYISFGNSYVHPQLDSLYITWAPQDIMPIHTALAPINDFPLAKFETIWMTLGKYAKPSDDQRFAALVSTLRGCGIPKNLKLVLTGPDLTGRSRLVSDSGFSVSSGEKCVLLNWPKAPDDPAFRLGGKHMRTSVNNALEKEKKKRPEFNIPDVDHRLYYIYSGP